MIRELNQVMEFIEDHLCEDITLKEIGTYAGIPDYHLRQLFQHLAGVSLSDYVKRRRLSEAGLALLQGKSVTEVAFTYGYQSLDGFSRAFRNWSDQKPSAVAKQGTCKKSP